MIASSKIRWVFAFVVLTAVGNAAAAKEDWPRFRGVNGVGISDSRGLPAEFGPHKDVLWKIASGAGTSSPVIANGQLYFSSFDGAKRTLRCVDALSGKPLWEQAVTKIREENATPPNGPATPTPASDGQNVFVLYPDVGVLCYSASGQERWRKPLEQFHSMHGIASSLVIVDNLVIVAADQLDGSYLAALDARTGRQVWKAPRVNGLTGGYSTPSIYRPPGGPTQLIASGPMEVVGYEAATGKRLWWITGVTNAPVSVPVIWHNRAFLSEPLGEPVPYSLVASLDKNKDGKISLAEAKVSLPMLRLMERIDNRGNRDGAVDAAEWDKAWSIMANKGGLVAIELGGSGDETLRHIHWTYKKTIPYIPSALVYEDLVYTVKDGGILSAFDAASGKPVKQARLKGGAHTYDASPIAADGKIYLLDADGAMSVVKAGRDWQQLATNEMGEPCWATPAICDGRIYVRTEKSLYCFGK